MNKAEIAELFIRSAWVDSRLPINAGPKKLKGATVPFYHTQDDILGRRVTGIRSGKEKEHLLSGDDPLEEWRTSFWENLENRLSRDDVNLWEKANELIVLVSDEGNRRALLAWAKSKVGTLEAHQNKTRVSRKLGGQKLRSHKRTNKDVSFAAWCRSEGIHEMTGSRRKDRAIAVIEQQLVRGSSQNTQSAEIGVLPVGPVFEHISDMIGAVASDSKGPTFERDHDTVFAREDTISVWREYRNARRRELTAKRRQSEAA